MLGLPAKSTIYRIRRWRAAIQKAARSPCREIGLCVDDFGPEMDGGRTCRRGLEKRLALTSLRRFPRHRLNCRAGAENSDIAECSALRDSLLPRACLPGELRKNWIVADARDASPRVVQCPPEKSAFEVAKDLDWSVSEARGYGLIISVISRHVVFPFSTTMRPRAFPSSPITIRVGVR